MKTDAKPMFLVNGVSPLPFSSGWTGRICREMDIQGMVKTQRHQKHSVLIIVNSWLWLSGDKKLWHVMVVLKFRSSSFTNTSVSDLKTAVLLCKTAFSEMDEDTCRRHLWTKICGIKTDLGLRVVQFIKSSSASEKSRHHSGDAYQ